MNEHHNCVIRSNIPFESIALIKPDEYIFYTIKKTVSITLSVYYCFNNFWRINIISCVIQSPADYMAEWKNKPLDPKTTGKKKKQLVNHEPHRLMAARLIKLSYYRIFHHNWKAGLFTGFPSSTVDYLVYRECTIP